MADMHMVPVHLEKGLTVRHFHLWAWRGVPAAVALSGVDSGGTEVVVVAHEAPIPFVSPRAKDEVELLHAERFRVDSRSRGTGDPFSEVRLSPKDPPDLLVRVAGEERMLGLECTRLADKGRLAAQAQLRTLREEVRRQPSQAFAALRGSVVYVQIVDEGSLGVPFRRGDPRLVELAELLATLDPSEAQVADGPPPDMAPDMVHKTPSGAAGASATRLPGTHQPTAFMRATGFELELAFTTRHSRKSTEELLHSLVAEKDRAENQILLITAGGADRDGFLHPSEEIVAELLTDGPASLTGELTHLVRVALHRWHVGDAWELYPSLQRIVAPMSAAALLGGPSPVDLHYPELVTDLLHMERNKPCLCASGKKAKHCHLAGVH